MTFFWFVILFTSLYGVIGTLYVKKKKNYSNRIKAFLPRSLIIEEEHAKEIKHSYAISFLHDISKRLIHRTPLLNKWEKSLIDSGISLSLHTVFGSLFFFILIITVVSNLLHFSFYVPIIFLTLFLIFFSLFLKKKKENRLRKFSEQLPDALSIMSTSIKAGFGFLQSMNLVTKEMPSPISSEFEKTVQEINLGISVEEAFSRLLKRVPNEDLKIAVTAIIVQRTIGGNLTEILDSVQQTIRDRVKIKEELFALTAQGRMSATVVTLLPIAIAGVLTFMNPNYFTPMLHHPLGVTMIVSGCVLCLLGWVFIRKIIRI